MKQILPLIVAGILLTSFSVQSFSSAGDIEAEKKAVRAVIDQLYQAFDRGDFEAAERLVSEDYEFISAAGKRMDWPIIRELLEGLEATGFKAEISNMKLKIADSTAWGAWNQLDIEMRGDKVTKAKVVITAVFEKIDGKWLWVHAHETKVEEEQ